MNRKERRAQKGRVRKLSPLQGAMALPHDVSPEIREMAGKILTVTAPYQPKNDTPDAIANIAEQKAQAIAYVLAHELSKMPDSLHRRTIIDEAAQFLKVVVEMNNRAKQEADNLTITKAGMAHLMKSGVGELIEAPKDIPEETRICWFSTLRGIENPQGEHEQVYYGKVYTLPSYTDHDDEQSEARQIEDREMDDLQDRFIMNSVMPGAERVPGAAFERYDTFNPDTGEVIVLYRVPYQEIAITKAADG